MPRVSAAAIPWLRGGLKIVNLPTVFEFDTFRCNWQLPSSEPVICGYRNDNAVFWAQTHKFSPANQPPVSALIRPDPGCRRSSQTSSQRSSIWMRLAKDAITCSLIHIWIAEQYANWHLFGIKIFSVIYIMLIKAGCCSIIVWLAYNCSIDSLNQEPWGPDMGNGPKKIQTQMECSLIGWNWPQALPEHCIKVISIVNLTLLCYLFEVLVNGFGRTTFQTK